MLLALLPVPLMPFVLVASLCLRTGLMLRVLLVARRLLLVFLLLLLLAL